MMNLAIKKKKILTHNAVFYVDRIQVNYSLLFEINIEILII